jgi:hypothetical protein
MGAVYAEAGHREDAAKVIRELSDLAKSRYVSPHAFNRVYPALSDRERFFEWLELEYQDRCNSAARIRVAFRSQKIPFRLR